MRTHEMEKRKHDPFSYLLTIDSWSRIIWRRENTRYMLFLFLWFPQIWTLFVKEQFPVTRFVICDQHKSQVKFSSVNTLAICRKYSQLPWTTEMSSTNLLEFINAHHVFDVITEPGVQQIISINVIICVL